MGNVASEGLDILAHGGIDLFVIFEFACAAGALSLNFFHLLAVFCCPNKDPDDPGDDEEKEAEQQQQPQPIRVKIKPKKKNKENGESGVAVEYEDDEDMEEWAKSRLSIILLSSLLGNITKSVVDPWLVKNDWANEWASLIISTIFLSIALGLIWCAASIIKWFALPVLLLATVACIGLIGGLAVQWIVLIVIGLIVVMGITAFCMRKVPSMRTLYKRINKFCLGILLSFVASFVAVYSIVFFTAASKEEFTGPADDITDAIHNSKGNARYYHIAEVFGIFLADQLLFPLIKLGVERVPCSCRCCVRRCCCRGKGDWEPIPPEEETTEDPNEEEEEDNEGGEEGDGDGEEGEDTEEPA